MSIPVNLSADFRGSALPVSFRLFNASGEEQYNETLAVPVLDYTASEADAVLKQVLADSTASQQHETLACSVLTPTNKGSDLGGGGGTGDRSKSDSGQNSGLAVSEESSTTGIVIAVLALIAAIAGLIGIVALPANGNFATRR